MMALSSPHENGENCVVLRASNTSWYVRYRTKTSTVQKCVVSTIIIWKSIFGQSRFTGKLQKFATVSSQNLHNAVCSEKSIVKQDNLVSSTGLIM